MASAPETLADIAAAPAAVVRARRTFFTTCQVFGVPLVDILRRTPGEEIPWVLKRFVSFLSKFGLEVRESKHGTLK